MRKNAIVAGIGFDGREKIIRVHCREGTKVILKRDPTNKYDENAIKVYLKTNVLFGLLGTKLKQIGFIKANTAKSLAKKMDDGILLSASVDTYWAPSEKEHPRVTIEVTDEI
ncbi:MAG: hypothetical protein COB62_00085 [Piscirickettsiaceae bacterium]|nr:MAG: hypothetical protein COB62_00085 [Piscirickettsiaceae bacterium]